MVWYRSQCSPFRRSHPSILINYGVCVLAEAPLRAPYLDRQVDDSEYGDAWNSIFCIFFPNRLHSSLVWGRLCEAMASPAAMYDNLKGWINLASDSIRASSFLFTQTQPATGSAASIATGQPGTAGAALGLCRARYVNPGLPSRIWSPPLLPTPHRRAGTRGPFGLSHILPRHAAADAAGRHLGSQSHTGRGPAGRGRGWCRRGRRRRGPRRRSGCHRCATGRSRRK